MNWFENQIKNRMQNDEDDLSRAFCELSSIVMGEEAANAGLTTPLQKTHNAVQEILKFFGQNIIPVPDTITDTADYIHYCLNPTGIMKRKVTLTPKWWLDAYGPMLGVLNTGDIVALLPSSKGYTYFDYNTKKRVKLNETTAKALRSEGYCFYKPFPHGELSVNNLVKYMFSTIAKEDAVLYLLTMAITTLFGLIQPKLSLFLYSYIIPQGKGNMLIAFGILMFSMTVSSQILGLSKSLVMNRLTIRLSNTIEPAAMMRMLSLPTSFFKKYAAGDLSQKFSLISSICNTIFSVITGTLLTSFFSLAYFTQIGNIVPTLLLPSIIIIAVNLIMNVVTTLTSIKIQKKSLEASSDLSGMTYSMLSGIQKIKLTGSEKRIFARWAEKYKVASNFTYNPPFILKYSGVISTVTSTVGLAVVYFISIMSNMDAGEYMAYNTAFGMVSSSILSLGSITTVISSLKPQLDIVLPILKAIPETSDNKTVVNNISGNIEVQNLTFRYEDGERNILDGINIKINAGQYVAIVGQTGCGKSTLMRLLLGFEKPNKGAVYYDGKNLNRLDLPSLRRKIGAVMQNGRLFTGNIFSNIAISYPNLTFDEAWEAARIADIAADIAAMPMGMHTIITEGSGGISGGQKQRLMIARAVASKPKVLIFDETTSALDNITQNNVTKALNSLNCTRIVIAHRLSTIKNCDKIYVMDKGEITEEGTFDELYANKQYFYQLVNRQMIEKED